MFRLAMTLATIVLILFAVYLLSYGTYVLWDYHRLAIPEAMERDAHGMSRLVGYTFILLLGVMSFGLGLLAWFSKDIADPQSQQVLTLSLFTINGLAFLLSLFCQIHYWESKWGRLYVATFFVVMVIFAYVRLIERRPD